MKFRTKPAYVDAIKFTRDNWDEVVAFTNGVACGFRIEKCINGKASCEIPISEMYRLTFVEGSYIIKEPDGSFSHCSPKEFNKLYEKIFDDELKESTYNPNDINMVLLTEEHLQRVVKEAVMEGIREDKAVQKWYELGIHPCQNSKLEKEVIKEVVEMLKDME